MRVLVVPEYGRFGGSRTYASRLVAYLASRGHETHLLIAPHQDDAIAPTGSVTTHRRSALRRGDDTRLAWTIHAIEARALAKRINADVVHVSGETLPPILIALLASRPAAFTLHTTPTRRLGPINRAMCRLTARRERVRIVAVSEASARQTAACTGVAVDDIVVIPNAYRAEIAARPPAELKSQLVLTIGMMESWKNPLGWLAVAQRVLALNPAASFAWVGDGSALEEISHRIPAGETRIVCHPFTEGVDEFYSGAAVYFQPSLQESQSISLVEASAHGIPCVVSRIGGMPEIVADGVTGYVRDAGDVDGLARAIDALLRDRDQRHRMGAAARDHVFSRYSPEQNVAGYDRLYAELTRP